MPPAITRNSPTIQNPDSVMVWGAFSRNIGGADVYFLTKNVTIKSTNCIQVFARPYADFLGDPSLQLFMHDGAPVYKYKSIEELIETDKVYVLLWPGNSPDPNLIENAWYHMK